MTVALAHLKELDTISTRRSEFTSENNPSLQLGGGGQPDPKAKAKAKKGGKGRGKGPSTQQEGEEEA